MQSQIDDPVVSGTSIKLARRNPVGLNDRGYANDG